MEGSGEVPPLLLLDEQLDSEPTTIIEDTLLRNGDFTMNPYRIGFVSVKTFLFLLVSLLSLSSKRDYIKIFLAFLLIPILFEISLDIYTEVKASFDRFPSTDLNWYYFFGDYYNTHIRFLPNEALRIYEDILVHYTSYTIFRGIPILSLLSFIFTDWLFWSLLVSSIPLIFFAFRSILRPEHIPYVHFGSPFVHIQPIVLILTSSDVLLSWFHSENGVFIAISALVKLISLIIALFILILLFISPFLLCRRMEERTKSSGFVYVRSGRSRLLWILLFLILINTLSFPYLAWSGLSLWNDISSLFSIDDGFSDSIATNAYVLHISLLPIRGFIILLSSLFILPNIRLTFFHFFCCCCRRH